MLVVPGQRSHHLDAARMLLMLLGIPYHAALLFQNEIFWFASASNDFLVAKYIVAFIHIFRMPAFFVVSGCVAAIVLTRRSLGVWLRERYLTLAPPLIFGIIVLHPAQVIMPALARNESLADAVRGKGVGHLWFLLALLGITTLVAIFRHALPRTRHLSNLTLSAAAYAGVTACIGSATLLRDWTGGSGLPLSGTINGLIWGIGYGLPYFLIGMLMVRRHDVARMLTLTSPIAYAVIALLTIAYVIVMPLEVDTMTSTIAAGLLAIPLTTGLLLACSKYLSFQSDKVDLMTRSSFTVYLVHHPIIVGLGIISAGAAIPWYLHYFLICVATWMISFGVWYGVCNMPVLNILLGAKPLARRNGSFQWRNETPKLRLG